MIANPYESISAQAEKMLRQELTSSELVEQCCERIEALDSRLGAFQLLCLERARVAGQAVERGLRRSSTVCSGRRLLLSPGIIASGFGVQR